MGAEMLKQEPSGFGVKKLIGLLSGLIGIASWQPCQPQARVAKCLTLAAVVSSIAVLMGRKGGEDLSRFGNAASTRTKASGESDVETRKNQDETREDEPVSQPGRDCSPGGSRERERELKPWMQPSPKLSALRSPITHVGLGTDLPWELNRFQTPPTGSDRWECLGVGLGGGEWWVRVLKKSRVRSFHPLHRGTPMSIGRLSATRVTVAFSRGNPREMWKRTVVTDDWIENRNADLEGHYEWCGYAFFYAKFGTSQEGGIGTQGRHDFQPGPLPPAGSVAPTQGYGGSNPVSSRAKQRGQKALEQKNHLKVEDGITYDGAGISACDTESIEGGEMTGYDLRFFGCGRRGEIDLDPGREARDRAQGSQDGIPPEADQLPVWMGIETPGPQQRGHESEPESVSDDSFELIADGRRKNLPEA